ncbi:MAG: hypothetical protein M3Z84_02325 [Actinomycetota bacterium]|nr:hypothetical protein [Actinomycetota bacterium]
MRTLGIVLLVVGYPAAIAVLVRLVPVLVQRRVAPFLVLESATACIVVGWLVLGSRPAAMVNCAFLVAFLIAWMWARARRFR